jgi:hypothetical protein
MGPNPSPPPPEIATYTAECPEWLKASVRANGTKQVVVTTSGTPEVPSAISVG